MTVSAPCVQPLVAIAGYVTDDGPENESVSVSLNVKLPAALLL